jgi:hypothetical protein
MLSAAVPWQRSLDNSLGRQAAYWCIQRCPVQQFEISTFESLPAGCIMMWQSKQLAFTAWQQHDDTSMPAVGCAAVCWPWTGYHTHVMHAADFGVLAVTFGVLAVTCGGRNDILCLN